MTFFKELLHLKDFTAANLTNKKNYHIFETNITNIKYKTNIMKNTYISTREVSDLINVTETTIKRWTDSSRLKCVKTLGGHRKYLLNDIEILLKKTTYQLPV